MNEKDASLPQTTINLQLLFELLGHKETNYAFFGVSRIRVISKIIGTHSPLSRARENKRGAHSWTEEIRNHNLTLLWNQWTNRWSNTLTVRKKPPQILNLNIFNYLPFEPFYPSLFILSPSILCLGPFWLLFETHLFIVPTFSLDQMEIVAFKSEISSYF